MEAETNPRMESDISELLNNITPTDTTYIEELRAKTRLKMERMENKIQELRMASKNQKTLSEIINNISTDSTDSEGLEQEEIEDKSSKDVKTCPEEKEIKTYYLFYKELDKGLKGFYVRISNLKPKDYFACILCDEDKDLIMEFENHFKYNADYIEVPKRWKYSNYRIHNLTKDKLKQEMDKFINKLGVGYYLDYFSTIKNWTGKD